MASEAVSTLRSTFSSGTTKPYSYRVQQLTSLLNLLEENENDLLQALHADLRKGKMESVLAELDYVKNDIRATLHHLSTWMETERPSKSLPNVMDSVLVHNEPYGVVLIIGAWNYPIQLVLSPLVGAISAGNCAIIKPSELAPVSAAIIHKLIPKYLDKSAFQVVLGGVQETQDLLKIRFDYVFFTGSTNVGKIVYQAVSKFLTPITLELGGKSPVYLDDSVDIEIAVNRIIWGKCFNTGQTCIAPDYLICSKKLQEKVIQQAKIAISRFYGEKIKQSPDYGRIISDNHFKRLLNFLQTDKIAIGGQYDSQERYIEPTILQNVTASDEIMQEEIFGPILPIVPLENVTEAIDFIKKREKPLAFYIFSNKKETVDLLVDSISTGGICVNDTLMHFSCDSLPFGGVGESGLGAYHGKYSFDTFSHKKPALVKAINKLGETLQDARYPPYNDKKLGLLKALTRKRAPLPTKYLLHFGLVGLGVIITKLIDCYLTHRKQN